MLELNPLLHSLVTLLATYPQFTFIVKMSTYAFEVPLSGALSNSGLCRSVFSRSGGGFLLSEKVSVFRRRSEKPKPGAEKNRENKNSFRCVVGSEQARIKNLTNRDRTEKVRESGPEMFPDSIFHLERDPGPKRVTDNH